MTARVPTLLVDASVVVKWKLRAEPHAAEAVELLLDWQHGMFDLCAPDQLTGEVMSAVLSALRKKRLSEDEAREVIRDLLSFPFHLYKATRRVVLEAFEIGRRHQQRGYDCIYVALAGRKGADFWTGDQRLCNALHHHFPLVRWIGTYRRLRP